MAHDPARRETSASVVIVGGGVIGSAIAYFLCAVEKLQGRVLVIEADPAYRYASTALSAASIRTQFSNAINIEISKFGVNFIRQFPALAPQRLTDLAFRENGYLFLAATRQQAEILAQNHAIQRHCGADVVLLEPSELKRRFPHLNCNDLLLGSFGQSGEGWFDNMGLLNGFISLAKAHGAEYRHGKVTEIAKRGDRVLSATIDGVERVNCDVLVNAAGPSAARVAAMAGLRLPVEPRKRTNFLFSCQKSPGRNLPLMIDPSGVFCRPEGDHFLCGATPIDDREVAVDDFDPRYAEFDDIIWPALAARSRDFEAIRYENGWAGHYAYNTFDQNAVIGPHPDLPNFLFANGFSGHGLQQAPAVGRGIAEWISRGHYRSLDLTPLSYDRIRQNRPFLEKAII